MKSLLSILTVAFLMLGMQSCKYAKSNQKVVISKDCGKSWEEVKAGERIPAGTGNRCFQKVVMPNYPMQGQCAFVSNFDQKVRVKMVIDYDYSISDPLLFIREAKYLGRSNADADDNGALDSDRFEGAENSVIDVRIRKLSKSMVESKDLVEADISNLEDSIFAAANELLKTRGITLNYITLTFDLDEQTRQAIDVATALRIYEASGISEIGKDIMKARAGATKITIESTAKKEDEKD